MNIDYIKNVCITGPTVANEGIIYKASGFPSTQPDEIIVRMIHLAIDPANVVGEELMFIWSDLTNDFIGSVLCRNSLAPVDPHPATQLVSNGTILPNIKLKVKKPIAGDLKFNVFTFGNGAVLVPYPFQTIFALHLDFIYYKK
jgi:hypothetical protein